jgi:O-antigen biosynthesis protein
MWWQLSAKRPCTRPSKLVARLCALARHPFSPAQRRAYREFLRRPGAATSFRPVLHLRGAALAKLCAIVPQRLAKKPDAAVAPLVSIIVPVHNQLEFTLRCLMAMAAWPSRASAEVIVCDDGSDDDTPAVVGALGGIRYLRNEQNLGFLRTCNRAAGEARGSYLVFLNNDTQVQEGWLDAMLALFEADARTGLVGARLVFPDGLLQEAGGIVWRDGSGHHVGRYDDPLKPEYNQVREVDYCSGACLMIETALFRQLGGFDERYAPAYYEDTDLAFRVRQAGRKVLYQPQAVVVHHEGASHGTDIRRGVKAHQVVNQERFRERWRKVLEQFHLPKP